FYVEQVTARKNAKAEVARLDQIIDGLDEILLERLPMGSDSTVFTATGGARVKLTRNTSVRYQTKPGKAEEFWAWVRAGSRWEFTSRTVLQSAVKEYEAAHAKEVSDNPLAPISSLPPFLEAVPTVKLGSTVTLPAPRA
ncbi:MAG TPA: hypothetical protein PLQ87_02250, partial [Phycisphaerae bacterium]|nr:hypothetical protein [Phycisphaerae bacterium]